MATNSANWMRYGPIKLNIVKLLEYKKEPVYGDKEKVHYMYTRHTLAVGATVYPDTDVDYSEIPQQLRATFGCYTNEIADSKNTQGNINTIGNVMPSVVRIDSMLRHFLMQPRQKLKYVIGEDIILESPSIDSMVDCNNGPKPVSLTIKKVGGLQSMYVEFVICTDVNESIKYGSPEYPVVSNQFSMEHEIDQDFYTTRKVSGLAHFRGDILLKHNYSPDDFREWLNIPSPIGFKRDIVKCRLHPDSLKLEYSFVDREMHHHLDTRAENEGKQIKLRDSDSKTAPIPRMRNITRLEVKQYVSIVTKSLMDAIGGATNDIIGSLSPKNFKNWHSSVQTVFNGVKNLSGNLMPVREEKLDITIYGNNRSEKYELEYLALFIIEKRLPFNPYSGMYTIAVEEDILGSFVKIHVTRNSSITDNLGLTGYNEATLSNIGMAPVWDTLGNNSKFNLNEIYNKKNVFFTEPAGIAGVTVKSFVEGEPNPALKDLNIIKARSGQYDQMRGTYLEQLIAESIRHSPDEPPLDDKSSKVYKYQDKIRDNTDKKEFEKTLPMGNDPDLIQDEGV